MRSVLFYAIVLVELRDNLTVTYCPEFNLLMYVHCLQVQYSLHICSSHSQVCSVMGESMACEGAAKRASGSGASESGDSDIEITGVQLAPRLAQHVKSVGLGLGLGLKHKGGKAAARSHSAATAAAAGGSQLCSSSTSLASIDSAASSASSAYASGSDQSSSSSPSSNSVCQPAPAPASASLHTAPAPAQRDLSFSPSAAPSQQPQHLLVYPAPTAISHQQLQPTHPLSPLVTSSASASYSYHMGAPQADTVYATPASAAQCSDMSLSTECAMEAEESLASQSQQQQAAAAFGLYSSWLQQPAFRAAPGKLVELSASANSAYAQQAACWATAGDAPLAQTQMHAHLLPLERWLQQQLVAAAAYSNSSGM